jgi:small subunit ribosomal protein S4
MGDPKKPRKKYSTPKNLWQADQLSRELFLLGKYGLRNKKELWKAETELSRIRKNARKLLAESIEDRTAEENKLLKSLSKKGIVGVSPALDDVLGLTVENLLDRRLQTLVKTKGLVKSIQMARQAVTHRHVMVKDRVITIPGYLVKVDEEPMVRLKQGSSIKSAMQEPSEIPVG